MDELLTVKEASRILSLSISTLYAFVHQKRIPYVKLGKSLRFRRNDLEQWVETQARPTENP